MKLSYIIYSLVLFSFISCSKDDTADVVSNPVLKHRNLRPLFHYSPQENWMNDPNGMVYYDGVYHLFYQYYPDGTNWGPMHWAHTVSTDLFHWEDKGIALYPDDMGYIFSGSAVVDKNNTAGFKSNDNDPLVAIFTHHKSNNGLQTQSLAYSTDKGETWTKYEGNPVLENPGIVDFRDPKVIWHEPTQKWIMTLAVLDHVSFYSSPNLIDWHLESEFGAGRGAQGGVWECPDLFPLQVEGSDEIKWVLLVSINPGGPNGGSATQYFIGSFDGTTFTSENNEIKWVDNGIDNYAGVTWSNISEKDGRRIFLGWMSNWIYAGATPTEGWRGEMTIPLELKLIQKNDQYLLAFEAVVELNNLMSDDDVLIIDTPQKSIELENNSIVEYGSYWAEIEMETENINDFEIKTGNGLESIFIRFDKVNSTLSIDRSECGISDFDQLFKKEIKCDIQPSEGKIVLDLIVDQSSLEMLINGGEKVMTVLFFSEYKYNSFSISGSSNNSFIKYFKINSIQKSVNH